MERKISKNRWRIIAVENDIGFISFDIGNKWVITQKVEHIY